jgi:hypothetical protein
VTMPDTVIRRLRLIGPPSWLGDLRSTVELGHAPWEDA